MFWSGGWRAGVCFNKMKREKMKERKKGEGRPKERRDVGEIEWMRMMGSGVRWGHMWSTKF